MGKWLSEPLIVSTIAQLFTLPLILYYFGRLSLVSPLANLLIVPVQAVILTCGGAATIVSLFWSQLGLGFYPAVWLFLSWTTGIVRRLANFSLASIEFTLPQWMVLCLVGVVLVLMILNATRPAWYERRRHQMLKFGTLWILPVMSLILVGNMVQQVTKQPDGDLHVVYLDMGQSNSVLIETPDGATFLIDGGRYPSRLLTALGDYLPTNRAIDVLFITSDENDDIGALIDVVRRYDVGVAVSAVQDSREQRYYDLLAELVERDIALVEADVGWRIETGDGVKLQVLTPRWYEDVPDQAVLRLDYGEATFLFTNRLSRNDELLLMANRISLRATVSQAADHAADKSNSQQWLEAVDPQVIIVQNDPGSWEPGAIAHVIARFEGRQLYRTDRHGTIEIVTDGQELRIRTENR